MVVVFAVLEQALATGHIRSKIAAIRFIEPRVKPRLQCPSHNLGALTIPCEISDFPCWAQPFCHRYGNARCTHFKDSATDLDSTRATTTTNNT